MTVCSNSFGELFKCELDKNEGVSLQRAPLYTLLNRVGATSAQIQKLSPEKDVSKGERHVFQFGLFWQLMTQITN